MKKCDDCQCDMIENCQIGGRHPFDVDVKQRVDIKEREQKKKRRSSIDDRRFFIM